MERITNKQLENFCAYLNKLTGNPEASWTRNAEGKLRANVGNYHISYAYGGACLHQHMSEGGGITCPIVHGHIPKRQLWHEMHAYARGIEEALRVAKVNTLKELER